MIDRGGVVHGGRRRRGRRRRAIALGLLTPVVALATLLSLMSSRASGPASLPRASLPHVQTTTAAGAEQAASGPPSYGTQLVPPAERVDVKLNLPLRSGLLFDVHTGQVLWQRHPDRVLAIASLTKMMTALIVVDRSRPSDRVLITPAATHFSGSGIGLLPVRKRVPLLPLLYGLLLPSGNDAAIALAQHVAGTQDNFIAMMNARAASLGLRCTHFTTVSGIVDQGNHSCATDLAVLTHLVLEQPLLRRIVASRSAILPFPIKGGKLYLYTNNPLLLLQYPGADGVKTGFTDASGPCLVAAARRGRTWLGVVLLHSGDIVDQAEKLLNAGFKRMGGR